MIADSSTFPTDPALVTNVADDVIDGMAEVLAAAYANRPGRELHPEVETFSAARDFVVSIVAGEYGTRFPGHIQVLRAKNRVAGFAVGAAPGDGVAFLVHVAVAPEFQNRGYGGRVVRAFLRSAGAAGYPRTALGVTTANPARHLYERLGFQSLRQVEVYTWSQSQGMSPGQ
jgi:ribosomal protein S18 acetylase RimI-like enzyme